MKRSLLLGVCIVVMLPAAARATVFDYDFRIVRQNGLGGCDVWGIQDGRLTPEAGNAFAADKSAFTVVFSSATRRSPAPFLYTHLFDAARTRPDFLQESMPDDSGLGMESLIDAADFADQPRGRRASGECDPALLRLIDDLSAEILARIHDPADFGVAFADDCDDWRFIIRLRIVPTPNLPTEPTESSIPEPPAWALLGIGLAGFALPIGRRHLQRAGKSRPA